MLVSTDPRSTIMAGIIANIGAIKLDNGVTNANVLHMWEGGPEQLKYLFFSAGYDIVISYGEPRSRSQRPIQDVPVHYNMTYPVTVSIVDKPQSGVLVSTASRGQYKVTYALRNAVAAFAQSVAGASPNYTLIVNSDDTQVRHVGGIDVYETRHNLEYETSYG